MNNGKEKKFVHLSIKIRLIYLNMVLEIFVNDHIYQRICISCNYFLRKGIESLQQIPIF